MDYRDEEAKDVEMLEGLAEQEQDQAADFAAFEENERLQNETFTDEDIRVLWQDHAYGYFLDILNGKYDIDDARADLRSLIGSIYDPRNN